MKGYGFLTAGAQKKEVSGYRGKIKMVQDCPEPVKKKGKNKNKTRISSLQSTRKSTDMIIIHKIFKDCYRITKK